MRKLIIIMLAAALSLTAFVSCKAEVEEEMLPQGVVGVSVEVNQDKALMMWVEDTVVSYEYRAVPQFDLSEENYNDGIFGEQQEWRVVLVNNYRASLGYYRQGRWVFYLRAKNRNNEVVMTGVSDPVYLMKGHDNVVRITLQMDDDRGADGRNLNTGKIVFGFETNMLDFTDRNIEHAYMRLETSKLNATGGIDAEDRVYNIALKDLAFMGAGINGFVSMIAEDTALDGQQDGRTDHEGIPGNAAHVPGSAPNVPNAPASDEAFVEYYMDNNSAGADGKTDMGFLNQVVKYTYGSEEVTGLYSQMPVQYTEGSEQVVVPRMYVPDGKTITELGTNMEYLYQDEVPQGRLRFYSETPDLYRGNVTTMYEGQSQTIEVWKGGISAGQYLVRALLCVKDEASGQEIIVAGQVLAVKVVGGETTYCWGTLVPEAYIPSALRITTADNVDGTIASGTIFTITSNALSTQALNLSYQAAEGSNITGATFKWYVDGVLQAEATTSTFRFVPTRYGDTKITCFVYGRHADGNFGKQASATVVIQVMPQTGANL